MGGNEFIDPACIIKARNLVQIGLELQTGDRLLVRSNYWGTWKTSNLGWGPSTGTASFSNCYLSNPMLYRVVGTGNVYTL